MVHINMVYTYMPLYHTCPYLAPRCSYVYFFKCELLQYIGAQIINVYFSKCSQLVLCAGQNHVCFAC